MTYSSRLELQIDSRTGEASLRRMERSLQGVERAGDRTSRQVDRVGNDINRMSGYARAASGALIGLAGAMSVREVIRMNDAWTNVGNQLRQVTGSASNLEQMQRRLVDVSKDTRSNFESTANLYARLAKSTTELNLTQGELVGLTQTINQSFAVSGASAQEASAAITQLGQALAAGALRGDEFNSVSEQAPELMRAIARSLDMTIGELRAFAAEGGITAEIVVNALQSASDTIDQNFGSSIASFGQKMEVSRTNMLEWIGTSDETGGAVDVLGDTILTLSENLDTLVSVGTVAAALYGGRLAGSMYAAATAKMTASGAALTLTGSLRGLHAASMGLFGPAGIVLGGIVALGEIGRAFDNSAEKAKNMEFRANELSESLQHMGETSIRTQLAAITLEMAQMEGAQEALEAQSRESSRTNSVLGASFRDLQDRIEVTAQANATTSEEADKLRTQQMALEKALELVTSSGETASRTITELGDSAKDAAKETTTLADAYESLLDRITPNRSEAKQYARDLGVLNLALASGRMTTTEYMQAMGLLQESFQAAQRDTEEIADVTDVAADEMARAWEEAANRIDETFADAFAGAFDSFDDFGDQLLDGFKRLLAELAYQATLKPIVVGFTADMQGLLNGSGSSSSGIGSLVNSGKSLLGFGGPAAAPSLAMQGGLSSAALASAGQVASGATYGGWAGSAASGAALGNSAGLASSITSGISAAMPWLAGGMLVDNVLGLGIVDGIADAISGIFGGKKRPSASYVQETSQMDWGEYDSGLTSTGKFGFNIRDLDKETMANVEQFGTAMAQVDQSIAETRTPEQLQSIKDALDEFNLATGNVADDLEGNFQRRLETVLRASGSEFAQFAIDSADSLGKLSESAVNVLNLENALAQLNDTIVSDVTDELAKFSGTDDFGAAVRQMTLATQAAALLSDASERLNLQFDATAAGAIHVASSLQSQFGGLENLAAIQSNYYQTAFGEAERLTHAQEDLNAQFAALNVSTPDNVAQIRQMIEAQDMSTDAGARLAYELMALTPVLDQVAEAAARQNQAIWDNIESSLGDAYESSLDRKASADDLYYWMTQIESGAVSLDRALQLIANSTEVAASAAENGSLFSYSEIVGIDGAIDDYNDAVSLSETLAAERKEQLQDELRAVEQLRGLVGSLMLSNQSILDPMERLQESQRQLAELQARAESGDTAAAGQLQGASTNYLDAAAAYYGQSSSQYADIFGDVTNSVSSLESQYRDSVDALGSIESIEKQLLREQQQARKTLMRSLDEEIKANTELGTLTDLMGALPDNLARALSAIIPTATSSTGRTYPPGGFDDGGTALVSGASGVIADSYREILGRDPDSAGLAYWESVQNSGASIDEIRESIRQSQINGSHASGLGEVPFDGYVAKLHKGETVLPAPLAEMYRSGAPGQQAVNLEPLTRELQALRQEVAMLRSERRMDASIASGQRSQQLGEQKKINKNVKLKERVS